MTLPRTRSLVGSAAIALLAVVLVGCAASSPERSSTPSPSASATESTEPADGATPPGGDESPPADEAPPPAGDGSVLITCFYPDGSEVGTFSRLEEAWASTNYVRIDSCEATASGGFELSEGEQAVADVAVADLPDSDPTEAYLETLAACVRLSPDGLAAAPTSVLDATTLLCPEAPHAGLIQNELSARGSG
ncbi:hypothetical protein [Agromyces sp. NPDC057865]|uniref:hypothetical protein n=1 Tax=Agromyces sp. NPDC057865 TaxID=3346267 RepID=UPI00366E0109